MSFLDINDKVLLFLSARSGRLEEEGTLQIWFLFAYFGLKRLGLYEAQEIHRRKGYFACMELDKNYCMSLDNCVFPLMEMAHCSASMGCHIIVCAIGSELRRY